MKALSNPRAVVFALSIALVGLGVVLTAAPAGAAVTVPGVPTKVKAVGVNTAIDVSWRAPLSTGGSPITGYVATAKNWQIVQNDLYHHGKIVLHSWTREWHDIFDPGLRDERKG